MQGAVVFDPDSSETHFLSELPALVLGAVDDTPISLSTLIVRLDGPPDLTPEARLQIHDALLSLERAELVTSEAVESD